MAPLPVITITYENRRTGMYGILVAPGVTTQSDSGDIPAEHALRKSGVKFLVRERSARDADSLYQVLEDVTKYPGLQAKPELWRIVRLREDDLDTVAAVCCSEDVEVAERELRTAYRKAVAVYNGYLDGIPTTKEGALWLRTDNK